MNLGAGLPAEQFALLVVYRVNDDALTALTTSPTNPAMQFSIRKSVWWRSRHRVVGFACHRFAYKCADRLDDLLMVAARQWRAVKANRNGRHSSKSLKPLRKYALVQNRYILLKHVGDPSEWRYTWQIRDDVNFGSVCNFCGRMALRITYEVTRGVEYAWICESCVARYSLKAAIDGELLGAKEARAYAHGLTARLKQETCKDIIRRLQDRLVDAGLEEIAVYFDRNLQLSPQRAAQLFSMLVQIGEQADAAVFEIQTRSKIHQLEFGALDENARSLVWIALSTQQRRRLTSLGFAPKAMPGKAEKLDRTPSL